MKKSFLFLLFFLSSIFYAQMDVEHWFAPMGNNYQSPENYQAVYLSTKETTPFNVEIYSESTLLATKTISKGKPETFTIPREYIITDNSADRMKVLTMGLHLIGTKKYFANLRFSVRNHAEIVTSKGLAGLGKAFYLGMPPVQRGSYPAISNHTASVIATENSTTVTLSGFDPGLVFTNDPAANSTKTVILNKGESYIFEVNNDVQTLGKGLIGAKIVSDKPISVSNGSFSGRIADTGVDIFMDQSIPLDKTGAEFIVMNGNGNLNSQSPSIMEQTLIIATEANTEVRLNNNTTSVPDYTLANAGNFVFVPSQLYFAVSATDNIFGLHIKTSKNVYVYQLLAGSSDFEDASGGMNLIPALSCFLPSKIDELSAVNENEVQTNSGFYATHNIKLNIIAQNGSDVYVNDSKLGLYGSYPVVGTDWELYSLFNATGNVTIEARNGRAITVGIAGGSTNVGYGGYFAGFSSVPAISKVGDCATGQRLEVDDIYDLYEWTFSPDNSPGSYQPYPASPDPSNPATYFITPGAQFGYYKCRVTKFSCLPFQETVEFKYLKCTDLTTKTIGPIGNCSSIPVITPVFTKDASITVNISKTFISMQPAGGRTYVDPATGQIHFDAENTDLPQVVFKYYFEGNGDFPDSEEVTVTVTIAQINLKTPKIAISSCLQNEMGSYNLKNNYEIPNTDPSISRFEYYEDANFTQRIPDSELLSAPYYTSKPGTMVYVKIYNTYNCFKTGEISLETFELPVINTIDVKNNTSVTITVTKGRAPYLYYIKKDGALDYLPPLALYSSSNTLPITGGKGVYTVYVKSADDCNPVTQTFSVIGISNAITPNGDGKNDYIDMSSLQYKINSKFQIFDRNGRRVFDGNDANHFIWSGKENGAPLPTGTYWYLLQWQDSADTEPDMMTGWILLKNRN